MLVQGFRPSQRERSHLHFRGRPGSQSVTLYIGILTIRTFGPGSLRDSRLFTLQLRDPRSEESKRMGS